MAIPHVSFTDERLDNGLRLVIAEDHLAPVAAVNIWYNVGSRHEVAGKTGFAHLFEHVMFQGSRNVGKAEHIAIVQAAGGVMNGTTWFDRTNYFETMPSHELELALWLEADRMGTLLEALSQDNLDNQREVVKNEKRWAYDNQPYGSFFERLLAQLYPPGHPYSHPTIGSMEDLDAASLEDVQAFFRTYYAPNNAVLVVAGDCDPRLVRTWARHYFEPIPANPDIPPLPDMRLPLTLGGMRRETIPDRVELARVHAGYRGPVLGDQRLYALELATRILAGGKGSRLHRRLVRTDRIAQDVDMFALGCAGGASIVAGMATVRPGIEVAAVEATLLEEIERLRVEPVTQDELDRAKALTETALLADLQRVETLADSLAMWATLFDDPGLVNEQLDRYLAVDAQALQAAAAEVFDRDNLAVLNYVPLGAGGATDATEEGADAADGATGAEIDDTMGEGDR